MIHCPCCLKFGILLGLLGLIRLGAQKFGKELGITYVLRNRNDTYIGCR
jgi:hypothetical protein